MNDLIYLRSLESDDLDRMYQWHNNQELYQKLIGTHHFVNRSTVEKWLIQKGGYSNSEINLAICLKTDDEHIGNVYLRDIHWVNRTATVGLFIGDQDKRGQGYGRQAIRQVINYAFLTIGLNRIYTLLFKNNEQSLHLFQRAGFSIEGTLPNHVYQNGNYQDVLFMGLCRDNWDA